MNNTLQVDREELRRLITSKYGTQVACARQAGLTSQCVYHVLKCGRAYAETVFKLSLALNVTPQTLSKDY